MDGMFNGEIQFWCIAFKGANGVHDALQHGTVQTPINARCNNKHSIAQTSSKWPSRDTSRTRRFLVRVFLLHFEQHTVHQIQLRGNIDIKITTHFGNIDIQITTHFGNIDIG